MSKRRTFGEQQADIESQIARLRERQREVMARESQADRKGESAMRHEIGGLVLGLFDGGWRTVDLDRLEGVVERNAHVLASCVTDEACVEEASRRTREWRARRAGRRAEPDHGDGDGDEVAQ